MRKKLVSALCLMFMVASAMVSPSKLMADPYSPAPVNGTYTGMNLRYVGLGIVVVAAAAAAIAASTTGGSSSSHS